MPCFACADEQEATPSKTTFKQGFCCVTVVDEVLLFPGSLQERFSLGAEQGLLPVGPARSTDLPRTLGEALALIAICAPRLVQLQQEC